MCICFMFHLSGLVLVLKELVLVLVLVLMDVTSKLIISKSSLLGYLYPTWSNCRKESWLNRN